jgi:hypothetical protein
VVAGRSTRLLGVMKTRSMLKASLASAAAFFVVPAVAMIAAFFEGPSFHIDGTPDNAPIRAAGVFLVLFPALFGAVAAIAFSVSLVLRRFERLNPQSLAVVVALGTAAGALLVTADPPRGANGGMVAVILGAGICVALCISAVTWWKVATWSGRHDA